MDWCLCNIWTASKESMLANVAVVVRSVIVVKGLQASECSVGYGQIRGCFRDEICVCEWHFLLVQLPVIFWQANEVWNRRHRQRVIQFQKILRWDEYQVDETYNVNLGTILLISLIPDTFIDYLRFIAIWPHTHTHTQMHAYLPYLGPHEFSSNKIPIITILRATWEISISILTLFTMQK